MTSLLIINIGQLAGTHSTTTLLRGDSLAHLPSVDNAWLLLENGRIKDFGSMDVITSDCSTRMDAKGGTILPSWCDSHTHIVFAASRESEFVDKINGLGYAEIAAKGGGILNSARKLADMSEDELYFLSLQRVHEVMKLGTGAIEIKSGYGLDLENELKMLRVIQKIKANVSIPVKATFLGAHAFPEQYRNNREEYIRLIVEEMIPAIQKESLADYIDVFCEEGFFNADQTIRICEAGIRTGLKPKIHANQLNVSGGVEAGVRLGARSVDHLESMNEKAMDALAASDVIGTMLPSAAFFLRMQYPPARQMIQKGVALSLASDFNPGSSPSGNMNLVVSLACIGMKMLPEEAINAATLNAAYAMDVQDELGSVTRGKRANFILTRPIPSLAYLPYSFGSNVIDKVFVNGEVI